MARLFPNGRTIARLCAYRKLDAWSIVELRTMAVWVQNELLPFLVSVWWCNLGATEFSAVGYVPFSQRLGPVFVVGRNISSFSLSHLNWSFLVCSHRNIHQLRLEQRWNRSMVEQSHSLRGLVGTISGDHWCDYWISRLVFCIRGQPPSLSLIWHCIS